jgi:amino acid transporter
MVSIWGYSTGSVLQSPRVLHAMAERGELPAALGHVHPRFRTPDRAILVFSAVSFALAAAGSFESIATLSAIVRLVTYGLTCAALPVLRRKRPQEEPGFRLPAAGLVAPLGAGFCLWLLVTRPFAQAWVLAAIVALGWALSRRARRAAVASAV